MLWTQSRTKHGHFFVWVGGDMGEGGRRYYYLPDSCLNTYLFYHVHSVCIGIASKNYIERRVIHKIHFRFSFFFYVYHNPSWIFFFFFFIYCWGEIKKEYQDTKQNNGQELKWMREEGTTYHNLCF